MNKLKNYIGKSEEAFEDINIHQVQKICATFGVKELKVGESLPHLWQWCFFVKALDPSKLGRDGHPRLGEFLPLIEDRNRMWAGGRFKFLKDLIIGKEAKKKTTIKDIQEKEGRSGKLTFVTLLHEYFQNDTLCISEEQDIVYKEPSKPKTSSDVPLEKCEFKESFNLDSTLLFRYSALTFNGHKIHYDFPYATEVEGYKGLVIHGPLLATFMINTFSKHHKDKKILEYSYQGLRPLCVPSTFRAEGRLEGKSASLWIAEGESIAHRGKVIFK
ncbi:hypothetical protein BKH43_02185 [Helicobacter sp. 13S00401-1]|uniref:FAS1-like dehydratase domain-containing protein n=1 Tax=Helicobacter sp. 13S00401-1 TaxID=1905758 RepID=UPI000BA618E6|nr:hypothetical protein [Helicobacter sp. 13S00401-1]PAF51471.1 hypothetical protein BKH43_02185 [Helicobacter sp. 13S00401-1]